MNDGDRSSAPGAPAREAGFTLVELTLVAALLSLVMGIVAMGFETSTRSLASDDLVAKAMETLQRSTMRIAQIARPCALTTYRVGSVAADIPLFASSVGEMIEPPNDGEAREIILFQSADGIVSMNAALLTSPRRFWRELESGETANGVDDDGDGLIDEGNVQLDYDGATVTMATSVESFSFTLTGRMLTIELHSAARARDGNVHRFAIREQIYVRNN